ncbi:MAG: MarR family transcriptional regulator [Deltaproteobacteria bacterium]|nr:MarR family transcriptional regulator [Deltaproteobacteria bacterium]
MANIKKKKTSNDLSLNMWLKFIRAHSTYYKRAAEHIKNFGLSLSQLWVIECLGHSGPLIMGELCKKTFLSPGNMTFVVDGLEKAGIAERVYAEEDRRVILVRLTPKGGKIYAEAFSNHAVFLTRLASVLTSEEQEELARLLKKLGLALSDKSKGSSG